MISVNLPLPPENRKHSTRDGAGGRQMHAQALPMGKATAKEQRNSIGHGYGFLRRGADRKHKQSHLTARRHRHLRRTTFLRQRKTHSFEEDAPTTGRRREVQDKASKRRGNSSLQHGATLSFRMAGRSFRPSHPPNRCQPRIVPSGLLRRYLKLDNKRGVCFPEQSQKLERAQRSNERGR